MGTTVKILLGIFALGMFLLQTGHAEPLTRRQLQSVYGHYEGGLPSYVSAGTPERPCAVDIGKDVYGRINVTVTQSGGVTFYSRTNLDSPYSERVLPSITFPRLSERNFLRTSNFSSDEISNRYESRTFRTADVSWVRIAYMDQPYAFVQINYSKSVNAVIYDSTLAYIDEVGCYNLRKIR